MKTLIRSLVRRIWSSPAYGRCLLALDLLAFRLSLIGYRRSAHSYLLVVAPSGQGNIGDQAMFDAFFANVSGKAVAVLSAPGALSVPIADRERVRVRVLPKLIRGLPPFARFADVVRFGRLLRGATRLYVPGADTIDGGHPHASLARLDLLHLAARAGVENSVLGFSWAPDVPRSVALSMRALNGTSDLYPRDPLSLRRLLAIDVDLAVPAADLVFSYDTHAEAPPAIEDWVRAQRDAGRPIVLLNVSGLIARKVDLRRDYELVVRALHERGAAVLYLPHVFRDGASDAIQCRWLFTAHGGPHDFLVDEVLSPAQVKGLAERAFATLTGRMHLAIMSLSDATPTVTMATAGKVEGLYEFFGLERFVIDPKPGCAVRIIANIDEIRADRESIAAQIRQRLPEVVELSRANFGLESARR